jgi:hypothetical protein
MRRCSQDSAQSNHQQRSESQRIELVQTLCGRGERHTCRAERSGGPPPVVTQHDSLIRGQLWQVEFVLLTPPTLFELFASRCMHVSTRGYRRRFPSRHAVHNGWLVRVSTPSCLARPGPVRYRTVFAVEPAQGQEG